VLRLKSFYSIYKFSVETNEEIFVDIADGLIVFVVYLRQSIIQSLLDLQLMANYIVVLSM